MYLFYKTQCCRNLFNNIYIIYVQTKLAAEFFLTVYLAVPGIFLFVISQHKPSRISGIFISVIHIFFFEVSISLPEKFQIPFISASARHMAAASVSDLSHASTAMSILFSRQ